MTNVKNAWQTRQMKESEERPHAPFEESRQHAFHMRAAARTGCPQGHIGPDHFQEARCSQMTQPGQAAMPGPQTVFLLIFYFRFCSTRPCGTCAMHVHDKIRKSKISQFFASISFISTALRWPSTLMLAFLTPSIFRIAFLIATAS